MSASITAQGAQESAEVAVQVRDRGTGLYELQFTLLQVHSLAAAKGLVSPKCNFPRVTATICKAEYA